MSAGWFITLAAGWAALIGGYRLAVMPWLARGPCGDPLYGLMWRILRLYVRLIHRVTYHGQESLRDQVDPGPLLIVSNHTGAVDPLIIQCGCRFQIRWMMATEMMIPELDWLWRQQEMIAVDRDGRDAAAARQAIRHLRAGGAVGIFPEGRIVRPPREVRPFVPGIGLIVAKTRVPVLLVWISGTPVTDSMAKSIFTPSQARVVFIDLIEFSNEDDATSFADELRYQLAEASGWPLNDEPMPKPEPGGTNE